MSKRRTATCADFGGELQLGAWYRQVPETITCDPCVERIHGVDIDTTVIRARQHNVRTARALAVRTASVRRER